MKTPNLSEYVLRLILILLFITITNVNNAQSKRNDVVEYQKSKEQLSHLKEIINDSCLLNHFHKLTLNFEYIELETYPFGEEKIELTLYNTYLNIETKDSIIVENTFKASYPNTIVIPYLYDRAARYAEVNIKTILKGILTDLNNSDLDCIILKSNLRELRIEAVKKLGSANYQDEWAYIIENEFDFEDRMQALNNLDTEKWQEFLGEIAQKPYLNRNFCLEVVKRLNPEKWESLLIKFAKSDHVADIERKISIAAINQFDPEKSQEIFADIAINSVNITVCDIAVDKLDSTKSQYLIREVVINTININTKISAINKLDVVKWRDLLINIALSTEESRVVRTAAINNLNPEKSQEIFAEIVEGRDGFYRPALEKIYDKEILRRLKKTAWMDSARRRAKEKLKEL